MDQSAELILLELKTKNHITNEDILVTYDKKGKSKHYSDLVKILPQKCTTDQIRGRIITLKRTCKQLRGSKLTEFLNHPFVLHPSSTATSSHDSSSITVSDTFQQIQDKARSHIFDNENKNLKDKLTKSQGQLKQALLIKKS